MKVLTLELSEGQTAISMEVFEAEFILVSPVFVHDCESATESVPRQMDTLGHLAYGISSGRLPDYQS